MSSEQSRRDTADNIYLNFDFSYRIADGNGWTSEFEGHVMKKTVFFEPDDPNSDEILQAEFAVRFVGGTNTPYEAVCMFDGEEIGNITGGQLSDYIVDEDETPSFSM